MHQSPQAVREYIEHLLDEGRIAPELLEIAKAVRPRFAEPSEASDSQGPSGSATHFAYVYEMKHQSVTRTGHANLGFQESIDCLKSLADPESQIRLLFLHNDGPLIVFLVEVAAERLVGLMFVELSKTTTPQE